MNKIKFRTWDNKNKEFAEWTNRDPFFSTSDGDIFFWERTKEDGAYGPDIILQDEGDRFVLQQFIGLTDKNGKDIFDGDILKFDPDIRNISKGCIWKNLGHICVFEIAYGVQVCFNHPFSEMSESIAQLFLKGYKYSPKFSMEVVGNIFENPNIFYTEE